MHTSVRRDLLYRLNFLNWLELQITTARHQDALFRLRGSTPRITTTSCFLYGVM